MAICIRRRGNACRQCVLRIMNSGPPRKGDSDAFIEGTRALFDVVADVIAGTVAYDVTARLWKDAFIEAVHRKLLATGQSANNAQVGLNAAVKTAMVSEVLERPQSRSILRVTGEMMIVERWVNDPDFADPETGGPARLIIEGHGKTFERLVERVFRGVTTHTVIESLTAKSVVKVVNTYWIELLEPDWKPPPPVEEIREIEQLLSLLSRKWIRKKESAPR